MLSKLLLCGSVVASVLLSGCGTVNSVMGGNSEQEARATMEWSYSAGGITLELSSDAQLNLYHGAPHTMVLGIVQMVDPNAFKALLADEAAVARLLSTGESVPPMLAVERLIVEPKRTTTVQVDRAQLAKYFGVVAGYYRLDPVRNARLFKIPVEVKSSGIVVKTRTAAPAPQRIRVVLGAERLLAAEQLSPAVAAATASGQDAAARRPEPESGLVNIDLNDVRQGAEAANAARRVTK